MEDDTRVPNRNTIFLPSKIPSTPEGYVPRYLAYMWKNEKIIVLPTTQYDVMVFQKVIKHGMPDTIVGLNTLGYQDELGKWIPTPQWTKFISNFDPHERGRRLDLKTLTWKERLR
jgi:hypothetical protein